MVSVRPVQAHEWRTYQALRLTAVRDSPDTFGSTYELEAAHADHFWMERIQEASLSDTDCVLLAEKEGQACGLIWCQLSAAESGTAGYLPNVGGAFCARFACGLRLAGGDC